MIGWFARNGVAANLIMLVVIVGGFASLMVVKRELFPEFSLDTVLIRIPYLGAAPEEVESGVILRVEEALQGVDGIKELRSTAAEGMASIAVEVRKGASLTRVKDDIRSRVEAIPHLPEATERPIIEELLIQRDVIWIAVFGAASEHALKEVAEKVRDEITRMPGISQAFVRGVRDYEISIEVEENALRNYNMTFDEVVAAVRRGSLDLPGGILRSSSGEILLRVNEEASSAADFGEVIVRSSADGAVLRLKDVATLVDGFTDTPLITTFNGAPAALVLVREVGDENPLLISSAVNAYVADSNVTWLPDGLSMQTWGDSSFYLRDRLRMLISNGLIGFLLVLLSLSLFLRPSLAFFVAIGIPVSFLGTFLIGPYVGISINLISLFAFILVLGIVVDDAIVVGESVFTEFQKSGPGVDAAIRGTNLVSVPVTFAVLTTIVAFLPVFFLPGQLGKFFFSIPMVVIPTLLFSLVQSKLVLPYHLSLCKVGDRSGRDQLNPLSRVQRRIADSLETFITFRYQPVLKVALKWRYLTVAGFIGLFLILIGFMGAGWVRFSPFPTVPSDFIQVFLKLPEGTPIQSTQAALDRISTALDSVVEEDVEADRGNPILQQAQFVGFDPTQSGSNFGFVFVELTKSEVRDSNAKEVSDRWRSAIGTIPGARELTLNADAGPPSGLPVDVRLTGPDFSQLEASSELIKERLAAFPGLRDIRDTFSEGKQEVKIKLKPAADLAGIRVEDVASQVRTAFYGAEAQRIQRGRDDIRIMVRYPITARQSIADLERMWIPTPDGRSVPISEIAHLEWGTGFPTISRIDRQRVIQIQANADKEIADFNQINDSLYGSPDSTTSILQEVQGRFPSVKLVKGGEAKDWEETREALFGGIIFVMLLIYALMAIPFKSYLQPLIVMCVIPFGLAGAIIGHLVTFQAMSILSMLGVIALTGVVVNDSLVLVDRINRIRREEPELPLIDCLIQSGMSRFRPILLTSLTTFAGLIPILLERSLQAQFLIPMATSLGFGVLFATFVTLLLVPCAYAILEDLVDTAAAAVGINRQRRAARSAQSQESA